MLLTNKELAILFLSSKKLFMSPLLSIILAAILSAGIVVSSIPKLVKIAKQHNIVDNPNYRKLNKVPVPILGGVSVFLGITMATSLFVFSFEAKQIFYLFTAMLLMLYIGVCDDITDMRAMRKLIYQILAVCIIVIVGKIRLECFQGLFGIKEIPFVLGIALTIFYSVGILNAINLIDGVDGLASGFGILVSFIFGISFFLMGDIIYTILCFATLGALLPFFLYNVFGKRNKMYIGDAGSLILGILFATLITLFINEPASLEITSSPITFMVAVFAIPIFDTMRVMVIRILKGHSPFSPDKTHLHHIILGFGFSHAKTTMLEVLATLTLVIVALLITGWPQYLQFGLIVVLGVCVTCIPTLLLRWYIRKYPHCIERRRSASELRRKSSYLYQTMRKLVDGKEVSIEK